MSQNVLLWPLLTFAPQRISELFSLITMACHSVFQVVFCHDLLQQNWCLFVPQILFIEVANFFHIIKQVWNCFLGFLVLLSPNNSLMVLRLCTSWPTKP